MSTDNKHALAQAGQAFGLHPIVGFGMAAVDSMLFAGTVATAGVTWVVSIPVAVALAVPCVLIQKHTFGDDWGTAAGKGLMIGVLTAIPTPLPATISLGGGVLGTAKMLLSKSDPKQIEAPQYELLNSSAEGEYSVDGENKSIS